MSPIKRAIEVSDRFERPPLGSSPKRLRGGGGGLDDDYGGGYDPLFEDDDIELDRVDDLDQAVIPEEILAEANRVVDEKEKQRWARPDLEATSNCNNDRDLNLQWLDMDVAVSEISSEFRQTLSQSQQDHLTGRKPILRTFGVQEDGHSVALFIHGFTPYAYFALPPGYELQGGAHATHHLTSILNTLNLRLKSATRGGEQAVNDAQVLGVTYHDEYKSIMGYDTLHTKFLKVYVSLPNLVPTLKRIMEEGIDLDGIVPVKQSFGNSGSFLSPCFAAFECNVPFVLRFMVDHDISGAGWLTLPANKYHVRSQGKKETHCQV